MQNLGKAALAELIGTYWLVFGGCGTAVLAGSQVGLLGVSIAFGLTIASIAYTLGPISGAHLNPAVSLGLMAAGRFPANRLLPYVLAQVTGAILAATTLYFIASGKAGAELGGFAANGYGPHSPSGFGLPSAFAIELVLTFIFLIVIFGVTGAEAPRGFAPLAIGAALMLIHLISIPVTNTSVNPARSTGQALFAGDWAVGQLWLFWVAPLLGAALAGLVCRHFFDEG